MKILYGCQELNEEKNEEKKILKIITEEYI